MVLKIKLVRNYGSLQNIVVALLRRSFPEKNFSANTNVVTEIKDSSEYLGVVGLEVHAQINSKSKLFSRTAVEYGSPTNTQVSFFDAAFPGTLPVLNSGCVNAGILTALACNCKVNKMSAFDRKHYFYPDLPAGYQITQQFKPLASDGYIKFVVQDNEKKIEPYECCAYLKQLQLEQDSGRSFHLNERKSLVDLNRAGIGLMELVFEPNLKNGVEAASLVRELINILRRIGTCTCQMEEGTLRVDANVSVHKTGEPFGVRTEVKNINSLRYIARAIDFEIERQIGIITKGGRVTNETRAYDYSTRSTVFMRDKEMLQDYRFMPEPNLPPIRLRDESDGGDEESLENVPNIDEIRKRLPILPESERTELINRYQLPLQMASKITSVEGLKNVFEVCASRVNDYSAICHFFTFSLESVLNARKISFKDCHLTAEQISDLIEMVVSKSISTATACDILEMLLNGDGRPPKEIVKQYNWYLITEGEELDRLCSEVISSYEKVAKKYGRGGKRRHMTTLLTAVNEKVNHRVCTEAAEATLNRMIDSLLAEERENKKK